MTGVGPVIRPERPGEEDAIRALHDAAFGGPDEGRIVDLQRAAALHVRGRSLVALVGGVLVGHLLASVCRVEPIGAGADPDAGPVIAFGPIAVLPSYQRRGIGAALIRAAIDDADRQGVAVIVLLGHPGYYARFGFGSARAIGLEPPSPWPEDSWMALRLRAWAAGIRGVVRYPESFGAL